MQVRIFLKNEIVTVENAHYYSFEKNFIVVTTAVPKTKRYFKLSLVLKLEETN